jgi:hypothetical protein
VSRSHQDDLAEQFCGEGIPAWAVDTTGAFAWLPFPMGVTDITAGFTPAQYENASIPGHAIPTRQACALHDWGSMQARLAVAVGGWHCSNRLSACPHVACVILSMRLFFKQSSASMSRFLANCPRCLKHFCLFFSIGFQNISNQKSNIAQNANILLQKSLEKSSSQVADALAAAYESLYTNPKWLAAWSNMWGVVAAFFKDRPEIIGIELINEPFAGDLYRDPLIMVPVRVPNAHVPSVGNRTHAHLDRLSMRLTGHGGKLINMITWRICMVCNQSTCSSSAFFTISALCSNFSPTAPGRGRLPKAAAGVRNRAARHPSSRPDAPRLFRGRHVVELWRRVHAGAGRRGARRSFGAHTLHACIEECALLLQSVSARGERRAVSLCAAHLRGPPMFCWELQSNRPGLCVALLRAAAVCRLVELRFRRACQGRTTPRHGHDADRIWLARLLWQLFCRGRGRRRAPALVDHVGVEGLLPRDECDARVSVAGTCV